jgi:hypothetical protein
MNSLLRAIGFGLLIFGIYSVCRNIVLTTHFYTYGWRGISAKASILAILSGIFMLVFLQRSAKDWGWIAVITGIILFFLSSRAFINPMSLWQFLLSFISIAAGYRMMTTGRSPL